MGSKILRNLHSCSLSDGDISVTIISVLNLENNLKLALVHCLNY